MFKEDYLLTKDTHIAQEILRTLGALYPEPEIKSQMHIFIIHENFPKYSLVRVSYLVHCVLGISK